MVGQEKEQNSLCAPHRVSNTAGWWMTGGQHVQCRAGQISCRVLVYRGLN